METTKTHYEAHTADSYENAFFYQRGPYMEYLSNLVVQKLHLRDNLDGAPRTLVDIGGGTGNFTKLLLNSNSNLKTIIMDPFLVDSKASEDRITFVKEPAETFMETAGEDSWRNQGFDQVLLKEVVHHFKDSDRVSIFKGILQNLSNRMSAAGKRIPSLLIITRPQIDIDYPLWKAAREVWEENQPHVDTFVAELKEAGFADVEYNIESYPCVIALDRWQSMVKRRFWSTFSNFSDIELNAACNIIAETYTDRMDEEGNLHFEDRLLFIVARSNEC